MDKPDFTEQNSLSSRVINKRIILQIIINLTKKPQILCYFKIDIIKEAEIYQKTPYLQFQNNNDRYRGVYFVEIVKLGSKFNCHG